MYFLIFQFQVETHPNVNCPYDYVSVLAGDISTRLCGQTPPKNITSPSNLMTIRFVTDGSNNMEGFLARFYTEGKLPFL